MRQHQGRRLVPGGLQILLTALHILLLVGVVLAYGLAIHLLNITH
jgi:hypothetical protein